VRKCQLFPRKSKGKWVGWEKNYDRTNAGNGEEGRRNNRHEVSIEK
jgi:hypothetical protein